MQKHTSQPPHTSEPLSFRVGYPLEATYEEGQTKTFTMSNFDRWLHAVVGRFSFGLSPTALMYAYTDWLLHLSMSPGKRSELTEKAYHKAIRLGLYTLRSTIDSKTPCCISPLPQDKRFEHELWKRWPNNFLYQSFLLSQQWWHNATTDVRGVSKHHSDVVAFATRQFLDVFSPSNFLFTNPEISKATFEQGGQNLLNGMLNFIEDSEASYQGHMPVGARDYRPGESVAITPGKVVFRNKVMELIQYKPTTKTVYGEPILISPAWIMKYYILDLSPHNSLVKYLVAKGYTVFMISWKNPGVSDRDIGMEDYRTQGIMAALKVISEIIPAQKIHGIGYCLGGTLLSIAAATMARDGNQRLKSITLLAAQIDYSESGELGLFIDESQVTFLEDIMWEQGYLDGKQMSGAFQLLRSKDLIWSRMIHDYLLGKRLPMFDLMAWNADATRLPYRMHSQYLRQFFLNDDLAEGRYEVNGRPIVLSDIRIPIFAVGTVTDHVSPWRSAYKIHLLAGSDVTFLLTTGGHNAGIISEPGKTKRRYQITTRKRSDKYIDPDIWIKQAPVKQGSWWPELTSWLEKKSIKKAAPPSMGNSEAGYPPLDDAPGLYVHKL
ncbi:MAG: alpha/beta fold hydrolase [Pseudomonadota bacterium]